MNAKLLIKKLLQSTLGIENYLNVFQKYLIYTSSSKVLKKTKYFTNKFKDLNCLIDLIHKGDVCVDIGANVGLYTIRMAKAVGKTGKVYSFEPITLNYNTILKSMDNFLKKIIIANKTIVGNVCNKIQILLPQEEGVFLHGLSHVAHSNSSEKGLLEEVDAITLDDYFSSIKIKINFIKCDVEGYEFNVLKGAKKILLTHRPTILCEIWNNPQLHCTFEFLENLGYSPFYVDQATLKKVDKTSQDWVNKNDYFFLPDYKNLPTREN